MSPHVQQAKIRYKFLSEAVHRIRSSWIYSTLTDTVSIPIYAVLQLTRNTINVQFSWASRQIGQISTVWEVDLVGGRIWQDVDWIIINEGCRLSQARDCRRGFKLMQVFIAYITLWRARWAVVMLSFLIPPTELFWSIHVSQCIGGGGGVSPRNSYHLSTKLLSGITATQR
jgi:hypothetical protein